MILIICTVSLPFGVRAQDSGGYPPGRIGLGIGEEVGLINLPAGNPSIAGLIYLPHFNLRYALTSSVALNFDFALVDTLYWLLRENPHLVLRGYDALLEVNFDPQSIFNPSIALGLGPQVNTIRGFALGLGLSAAGGGEYFFDPLISLSGGVKSGLGLKVLPLLPQVYWYGLVVGFSLNFYL